MAAEERLIKSDDLKKAAELDFVFRFEDSLNKLLEVLGTTRKIAKVSGTNLKAYKASGTLQSGEVDEGDVIPLSHYQVDPVSLVEMKLKKWRKSTSIEAVSEKGRNQAVLMTTDAMLRDVQKGIKNQFFTFLGTGTGTATGDTFQSTLANTWGQLQKLYEDTEIESVYFMNPLDVATYLGTANISIQTVFGMKYVEDFLGLGTVIFNSQVPAQTIYGTAKENIVLYYVNANDADISADFDFTIDPTGYIGIHRTTDYDRLVVNDTVMSGVVLFAERLDGVVKGTIEGE